jgi:bifunctional UDP-N-acetylglucosamine pyrophosphorylase/glucosamine-1-phosphate N-acetyltransferase
MLILSENNVMTSTPASIPSFACVILAAGRGTRMKSDKPKLMHEVANLPIIKHVIRVCEQAGAAEIVVVVAPDDALTASQIAPHIQAIQHKAEGTGKAAQIGMDALTKDHKKILILNGDMPLLLPQTLQEFAQQADPITIMAMDIPDPRKFGRLVTGADGKVEKIVEFKDATDAERAITLCNTGVYAIGHDEANDLLNQIDNNNASGEYYLTDIVAIGKAKGLSCGYVAADWNEIASVNNKAELAELESLMQNRLRQTHLDNGVTLIDPQTVYFSMDTVIGRDVTIEPHVYIGTGVTIKDHVRIKAFSHLDGATLDNKSDVGPFARLRPGAHIGESAHIGNFVEVKKSTIGAGTKIGHLSYIGDAQIGSNVNIGAGVITCNYDGFAKHTTTIGDGVFVGSNTILIAPVKIESDAMTGAGSVIGHAVPSNALAIARADQHNLADGAKRYRDKRQKKE